MWKIISLSALLIVAQAADIRDFYGDWIQLAYYPVRNFFPECEHFTFAKSTQNVQCTYVDGKNVTFIQGTRIAATGELERHQIPMRVVDTSAEVMPALNISIKCGDKDVHANDRAVVRLVNEDYFIAYSNIPEYTRSAVDQNRAILFGRNVVSSNKLSNVIMSIEDLKDRRGVQICVAENYRAFNSTENEVGN